MHRAATRPRQLKGGKEKKNKLNNKKSRYCFLQLHFACCSHAFGSGQQVRMQEGRVLGIQVRFGESHKIVVFCRCKVAVDLDARMSDLCSGA